ncbi:MAG: Tfx family DNA-binding protein [Hadesarchaea archaeon]|nr:Tfx family DNA-binding protein [Hadesarchaea archaeon]
MSEKNTFLTETQEKVLRLRNKGLTQAEVARELDSSRANICNIEKRAKKNIGKARETLMLAEKIESPVSVIIEPGEDILDAAKKLFRAADEEGIRVSLDTPELVSEIQSNANKKLDGRRASEEIKLFLNSKGDVIVS